MLVWETATDPEMEKQLNKIIDFQQLKKILQVMTG